MICTFGSSNGIKINVNINIKLIVLVFMTVYPKSDYRKYTPIQLEFANYFSSIFFLIFDFAYLDIPI